MTAHLHLPSMGGRFPNAPAHGTSTAAADGNRPACAGIDPSPFDWPHLAKGEWPDGPGITAKLAAHFAPAIAVCRTCPILARAACDRSRTRNAEGVFGGHVWKSGRKVLALPSVETPTGRVLDGVQHGCGGAYKRGCRCIECKEWARVASAKARARRRTDGPILPPDHDKIRALHIAGMTCGTIAADTGLTVKTIYRSLRVNIDEAVVTRLIGGERVEHTRPERREAVRRMTEAGMSAVEIARRLGVSSRLVQRARRELREAS